MQRVSVCTTGDRGKDYAGFKRGEETWCIVGLRFELWKLLPKFTLPKEDRTCALIFEKTIHIHMNEHAHTNM